MAGAALAAARQVDLSKLPLFHANPKTDAFTAEEWAERVQLAKDGGPWDDALATSYVYNALRDGALTWYRTLKWSNIDNRNWAEVKQAFLEAYGTTHTSRTTATALNELKQGNDSVIDYYTKVVEVMSDLQALLPPNGLGLPTTPYPAEITAVAQFRDLREEIRTGAATALVEYGAQRMIYFIATQIFVSGLKAEIRTEVMKSNPLTVMAACTAAQTIEKINTAKKPSTSNDHIVAAIGDSGETDESPEQIQAQIDELQRRKQWVSKKQSGSGPSWAGGGSTFKPGGTNQRGRNPAMGKKCHYCKKLNHFQKDCRARIAAGAPMIPPPGRVSEQRPTNDSADGQYAHPFAGQAYSALDGIYGTLN